MIRSEIPDFEVALFHNPTPEGTPRVTYMERKPNRAALYVHLHEGTQRIFTFRAPDTEIAAIRAAEWWENLPRLCCYDCGERLHAIEQTLPDGSSALYVTCYNPLCRRLVGQTVAVREYPRNLARFGTEVGNK